MRSSQQQQNPLRISSESLNLDDIISDLNSDQKPAESTTSQLSKQSKKPSLAQTNLAKQPSKSKIGPSTYKENQNTVNKPLKQAKPQEQSIDKKDFLISTTTAQDSDKKQFQNLELPCSVSNRYIDSNCKSTIVDSQTNIEEHETSNSSRQQILQQHDIPFYMNRQSAHSSITDEDVESFQKKLDTLIINFRSETMSEFMKTKKLVLNEQAQTIDAERRRCNTMLGVKQNEIEQLKESLGNQTKNCAELQARCEGMSFWAGKSKTLLRIKLIEHQSFEALKSYCAFKKHSKQILSHRLNHYKESLKRKAFIGWEKQYKEWKIVKNQQDFDKAVKQELQSICAQYNKEIESLREKLNEANAIVEQEARNKAMMQENLKKAFMRGVCALNFEAMSILTPGDSSYQNQIEIEMEKQVMNVMNGLTLENSAQKTQAYNSNMNQSFANQRIPTFNTLNESSHDTQSDQRKFMQIDQSADLDYKRVESKDNQWKPAPIMGRDLSYQAPNFVSAQPQITAALRQQTSQNFVLPSHFQKMGEVQINPLQENTIQIRKIEEDMANRTALNPQIITSNLPDFFGGDGATLPQVMHNQSVEGKTIFAGVSSTGKSNNQQNSGQQKSSNINGTSMKKTSVSVTQNKKK